MYGKIINGTFCKASNYYKTDDGQIITNFNMSVDLMTAHGFKPIIENKPTYDTSTQCLKIANFEETETNIIITYVAIIKPE